MKRVFLLIALCFALVACSTKPSNMHGTTYNVGLEAVKWCTRYDEGKITETDLKSEMDKLVDQLKELDGELEGLMSVENLLMQSTLRKIGSVTYRGKAVFYEGFDELKEKLKK